MLRHITGEISLLIVKLSREGRQRVAISRIYGVAKSAINKILGRARQTGSPNHRPLGHQQRISSPLEDPCLLRMMHGARLLSSSGLKAHLFCGTERCLSVCTITRNLLAAGYHSCRPARCPKLTLVHRRSRHQWAKHHRVWDILHWRHCIFTDKSRLMLRYTYGRDQVRRQQAERHIDFCV